METNYYYVDHARNPVGPVDRSELQRLAKTTEINGATLIAAQGEQEWKTLIEIFPGMVVPAIPQVSEMGAPPVPPERDPALYRAPAETVRNSAAVAHAATMSPNKGSLFTPGWRVVSDEVWLAFIIGSGINLLLEVVFPELHNLPGPTLLLVMLVGLAGVVIAMVLHYRCWATLPLKFRETTPAFAVGGMFIPFFGLYWVFKSYQGLVRGLKSWEIQRGITYVDPNEGKSPWLKALWQMKAEWLATAQAVIYVFISLCFLSSFLFGSDNSSPPILLSIWITVMTVAFYYKVLNRLDALASSNA